MLVNTRRNFIPSKPTNQLDDQGQPKPEALLAISGCMSTTAGKVLFDKMLQAMIPHSRTEDEDFCRHRKQEILTMLICHRPHDSSEALLYARLVCQALSIFELQTEAINAPSDEHRAELFQAVSRSDRALTDLANSLINYRSKRIRAAKTAAEANHDYASGPMQFEV